MYITRDRILILNQNFKSLHPPSYTPLKLGPKYQKLTTILWLVNTFSYLILTLENISYKLLNSEFNLKLWA